MHRFRESNNQIEVAEALDQKLIDLNIFPGSSRTFSPRLPSARVSHTKRFPSNRQTTATATGTLKSSEPTPVKLRPKTTSKTKKPKEVLIKDLKHKLKISAKNIET